MERTDELRHLIARFVARVEDHGELELRFEAWRDGKPLLLECLRVTPSQHARASGLRGHSITATLLANGVTPETCTAIRQVAAANDAVTLGCTLLDDLLVIRCLGDSTARVKAAFTQLWCKLRDPVLGNDVCLPRIWAT